MKALLLGPVYSASEVKGMPWVLTEVAEQLRVRGWQVDSHTQLPSDTRAPARLSADRPAAWVGTTAPSRQSLLDRHPALFRLWNDVVPGAVRRLVSATLRPAEYFDDLSHNLRVAEALLPTAREYDLVLLSLDEAVPGTGALLTAALPSVAIISLYNLGSELRPGFNRALRWMVRLRFGKRAHPFLYRHLPPRQVQLALFGSRTWRDQAVEAGLPAERARVIYFGVPQPPPLPRPAHAGHRILLVGRLSPEKGAHVLLGALPLVRAAIPGVTVTIVAAPGPPGYRRQLMDLIRERGLEDAVTIEPAMPRAALAAAYASHDVLFFHSVQAEPVALVLMEAYTAGIPVAASRPRSDAALIRDRHTCLCYDAANRSSVANAMITLLGHPELGQRLAAEAQRLVRESFSIDVMGQAFDATLRQFVADRNHVKISRGVVSHLDRLIEIFQCPACHAPCGRAADGGGLVCERCRTPYRMRDGVLIVELAGERPEVTAEQEGVRATERNAALGGINADFDDLAHATGELKDAILALPQGNDSRYYSEPGYFLNVKNSLRGFHFVTDRLRTTPGQRLLDVGADLTWSTNHFAGKGLRCTAIDVNHHLSVGELFQAGYHRPYDMVRVDMHAEVFRSGAFDLVVAINALHHSGDIDRVAGNLARVLSPGGRLAAVEPYCVDPSQKADFGREQIEAGINENTYLLDEWHAAFTGAGLVLEELMLTDSCNMIYRKPQTGEHVKVLATMLEGAHAGRLAVRPLEGDAARRWVEGNPLAVSVEITNLSNATWCSEGRAPIFACYHLSKREGTLDTMVEFDNPRTAIPDIAPGGTAVCEMLVRAPHSAGTYVMTFDLVQEGICWFAERGFKTDAVVCER